jgi:phosphomannomutase
MKNPKFIFDVDGTLTPSRAKIDPEFKNWFLEFCQNNEVYLVTGSDYDKTVEQLGEYLCRWPIYIYNCSGNEVWGKGQLIKSKQWNAPTELYDFLNSWLTASKFPARTGKHIEDRAGCINFSVVGRNATLGERKLYKQWDEENRERESIAFQINSMFDDITATIGGETGIDIHPTGWDKSQILKDFDLKNDRIFFFGDKTLPGGNDYPIAAQIKNSYQVNTWKETWETLCYLKDSKIAS